MTRDGVSTQFSGAGGSFHSTVGRVVVQRDSTRPVDRFLNAYIVIAILLFNNTLVLGAGCTPVSTTAFVFCLVVLCDVVGPLGRFSETFCGVPRKLTDVRQVSVVLGTRGRVMRPRRPLPLSTFASGLRFGGMDFDCMRKHPILGRVGLAIPGKGAVTLINRSNSKGSALISLMPHCRSMSRNTLLVSNGGIGSMSVRDLHSLVNGMGRRTVLFGSAFCGGVAFNMRGTAVRRMVRTTGVTGTRSFVVRARGKCSAVVNSHKKHLSNNRHRHIDVTHTVLGGPPVLVLSRTASTLSARSRHLIRRTLRHLVGSHAAVTVTRELDAVGGTSRVYMLCRNSVMREKARSRLVTLGKCCGGLGSVRSLWDKTGGRVNGYCSHLRKTFPWKGTQLGYDSNPWE